MLYTSTRDKSIKVSAAQAIAQGISEEGGLFVPCELPKFSNMPPIRALYRFRQETRRPMHFPQRRLRKSRQRFLQKIRFRFYSTAFRRVTLR